MNKQLLAESLSQIWKKRLALIEKRHVTPLQIYVALHELAIRLCEPFTVDQIVHQMSETFNVLQLNPSVLPSVIRREVKNTLFEGIAFGWYRCSNAYRFKASHVPPPKIQLDHKLNEERTNAEFLHDDDGRSKS
uniref:Uncharacterized protein n=1 Tax=Romanomermis culicivorax TaxID=13658 RepID=A0A915IX26_ROMCU